MLAMLDKTPDGKSEENYRRCCRRQYAGIPRLLPHRISVGLHCGSLETNFRPDQYRSAFIQHRGNTGIILLGLCRGPRGSPQSDGCNRSHLFVGNGCAGLTMFRFLVGFGVDGLFSVDLPSEMVASP
jgi:hypothetical protein